MPGATIGLDMKAEGYHARKQKIPGERFAFTTVSGLWSLEVKDSPRGPQIILSRAHRNFLRRLLENEVPEIYHGIVEIRSIAREPGARAKVAVSATQPGVDPVGACVGIRGVRIQAIVQANCTMKRSMSSSGTLILCSTFPRLSARRASAVSICE